MGILTLTKVNSVSDTHNHPISGLPTLVSLVSVRMLRSTTTDPSRWISYTAFLGIVSDDEVCLHRSESTFDELAPEIAPSGVGGFFFWI